MESGLVNLQRYIVDHFDHEDLRSLCKNLGIDYDHLPWSTRAGKAGELVRLMHSQDRLPELETALKRHRMRRTGVSVVFRLVPRAILALAAVVIVFMAAWLLYGKMTGLKVSNVDVAAKRIYLQTNEQDLDQAIGDDDTLIAFEIKAGQTGRQVASQLKRQELIKDDKLFRYYLDMERLEVQTGEYWLNKKMTPREIANVLQLGLTAETKLTIPEGRRLEEIAELATSVGINRTDFISLVTTGTFNYNFLREKPDGASLEGYLFPDTYRLSPNTSARELIERMLATFEARVTSDLQTLAAQQGLTLHQVVTLASIVEREAIVPDERPIIASVYLNRLNQDWKLDADPTVQYPLGATGDWWPQITVADYTGVNSPYNTYLNIGLPPGPIANPGLASIQAVLQPAETNYVYFMRDCETDDGSHWFAINEQEHLDNYARCTGQ